METEGIDAVLRKILTGRETVVERIQHAIKNNSGLCLSYLGFYSIPILHGDAALCSILQEKFELFPDGVGMSVFLRLYREVKFRDFAGTDMYHEIFTSVVSRGIEFAIIGGSPEVHEKIRLKNFSGLQYHRDGFFFEHDIPVIVESIKDARIIFVGMGFPLQEKTADVLARHYPEKVFLCVGNFLEFSFGNIKRAPELVQRWKLEWMYRLIQEPRRLWRRYLMGIPLFMARALILLARKNRTL